VIERINSNVSQILDNENNRQDKAGIMSQLSQEFDRHLGIAEECAKDNDLGRAEAYTLIAEFLHETLKTFEAIKE
jgi:hypothetical protein